MKQRPRSSSSLYTLPLLSRRHPGSTCSVYLGGGEEEEAAAATRPSRLLPVSRSLPPSPRTGKILPASLARPALARIPQSASSVRSTCLGVDTGCPTATPRLPRTPAAVLAAGSLYRRLVGRGPGCIGWKPHLCSPSPGCGRTKGRGEAGGVPEKRAGAG